MNIKIDFTQNSTKRGAVLVAFSMLAFYKLAIGDIAVAAAIMATGQQVAGWLGVILNDKQD